MNASTDPLCVAWENSLAENRDRPAVLDPRGKVCRTFADVEERARLFSKDLQSVTAGEVIAIQIGNHPDWPSLLIACLRRGVVALPLELSISEKERAAALQICGAGAVFALLPGCSGSEVGMLRSDAGNLNLPPRGPKTTPRWEKDRPSLLKLTSGTTAAPRAIRFSSDQLLADCENICETMEITRYDLNYGVIPISHSYGFSNLLTPLLARGVAMVLSRDRMPRAIIEGLAASRATVFPAMPVFYQSLCELTEVPSLPELRLCISAGAPLPPELARKFQERFDRDIHTFYGSSECGGICYAREPAPLPGLVGQPLQGVEIEPVEVDGGPSRIRVRSRAVGDGYFPEPDESKLGRGRFFPDDLLQKTDAGYRIVGRVSDLINVAGKKVNPAEVEAEILNFPGVHQTIAFGRESQQRHQEVVACVVANGEVSEAQLLNYLRSRLSSWQVPRRIYFVDAIPVNERGKTSRRELAEQFN